MASMPEDKWTPSQTLEQALLVMMRNNSSPAPAHFSPVTANLHAARCCCGKNYTSRSQAAWTEMTPMVF